MGLILARNECYNDASNTCEYYLFLLNKKKYRFKKRQRTGVEYRLIKIRNFVCKQWLNSKLKEKLFLIII